MRRHSLDLATEGDWVGVRPSSGAAALDLPGALECFETLSLADVAAPEDGRTPAVGSAKARLINPLAATTFTMK